MPHKFVSLDINGGKFVDLIFLSHFILLQSVFFLWGPNVFLEIRTEKVPMRN